MLPFLFTLLFLVTLFTAYSMLSHIFMAAPFVPTKALIIQAMVQVARLQPHQTVIDLGCGDGRLLIAAKKAEPTITAIGYELVPAAYVQAKLRSWLGHTPLTLYWRSLFKARLQSAQVVFVYLYPKALEQLLPIFAAQLTPGTIVISNTFAFKERTPTEVLTILDGTKMRKIYVYEW